MSNTIKQNERATGKSTTVKESPPDGDAYNDAPKLTRGSAPPPPLPILGHESTFGSGLTVIDLLLQEQQNLSAVDLFSRDHDNGGNPTQQQHYSKLMPASPPRPGQQYGFDADLDRCSGCKACVAACHTLNGLDENETWRDVGLLIGGTTGDPVMQHVTTACHHCLEPGCMSACPVNAYEKDPVTGIVKHLDDQCFGCQYCTLACPYDVPKYHSGKGIVRKCDMCADRLADGEAPACVQSCPHEAISIRIVETAQVVEDTLTDPFLPGAPNPQITLPTTNYRTSRVFPRNTLPADYHAVNPQHPHWPLIVMLVLTQLSIGAFIMALLLEPRLDTVMLASFRPLHATLALMFGLVAIASSTLHLGRPQYAFRAMIGLRHSWLSREIFAFGAFAGAACCYAALNWLTESPDWLLRGVGWIVAASGCAGLFCSVMIYHVTKRELWSFRRTMTKFVLTSAILGCTATWLSLLLLSMIMDTDVAGQINAAIGRRLIDVILVASTIKLIYEACLIAHLFGRHNSHLKQSARLLVGPLANPTLGRFACGILGGIVMPLFLLDKSTSESSDPIQTVIVVAMMFVAALVGELLERYLFFAAVSTPRMPGRVTT